MPAIKTNDSVKLKNKNKRINMNTQISKQEVIDNIDFKELSKTCKTQKKFK